MCLHYKKSNPLTVKLFQVHFLSSTSIFATILKPMSGFIADISRK